MEAIAIGVIVAYLVIKMWRFVLWLLMVGAVMLLVSLHFLT